MLNDYAITFDVDWASDEIIQDAMEHLLAHHVKSTWFVTHDSPAIRELCKHPGLFEVGLHPNFFEGSTQGNSTEEIMDCLKNIAPQAKSMRTHALYQSNPLMHKLRKKYGMENDSSIFLSDTPYIIPHKITYLDSEGLIRLPYFWGDLTEVILGKNGTFNLRDPKYGRPGLKIFTFHPIHVFLNTEKPERYQNFKEQVKKSQYSKKEVAAFVNREEKGVGTFFEELVQLIKNSPDSPGKTIAEIAENWANASKEEEYSHEK